MIPFYKFFPNLDSALVREFVVNNFIKNNAIDNTEHQYKTFGNNYVKKIPEISSINDILMSKYNFPEIEYFVIFKLTHEQAIHVDGSLLPRLSALNLPVQGYENTRMNWYESSNDVLFTSGLPLSSIENLKFYNLKKFFKEKDIASYYNPSNLTKLASVVTDSSWILVNTGIPHNVSDIQPTVPRFTISLRFKHNPTIQELSELIK